jgi:propionyl-CoA carboxylase alpha chain
MQRVAFARAGAEVVVEYMNRGGGRFDVVVEGEPGSARLFGYEGGVADIEVGEARRRVRVLQDGDRWHTHDGTNELTLVELPRFPDELVEAARGSHVAPMPGKVLSVHVAKGDRVREGDLLVIVEAMKMEHHITAAQTGVVSDTLVTAGQQVDGGAALVIVTAEGNT